jgi:hypothetical protein
MTYLCSIIFKIGIMPYYYILGFTLSLCIQILNAQNVTFNIPINLKVNQRNHIIQNIDLSKLITNDFIAISLKLEGANINNGKSSFSMVNSEKKYLLPLYGEIEKHDVNSYISELIYLKPEDAGIWFLNINSTTDQKLPNEITGFIRVFVPDIEPMEPENNYYDIIISNNDCNCPLPLYIKRQEWGTQFGLNNQIYIPPASYTKVTHLIIHHSAGINESNNWKAVVASIFDFHVNTNGWQDIGYNWLIDPNGKVYEGRGGGENVRGSHMCSYNNNTMGICMLGNFELVEPKEKAIDALKTLLGYKACKEDISPEGSSNIASYSGHMHHISGHLEGCAPAHTMCPGKFLFSKLASIRSNTDQFIKNDCIDLTNTMDNNDATFTLYPNPTDDLIYVSKLDHLKIFNILGNEVTAITEKLGDNGIDVSRLTSGLYFVQNTISSQRYIQKFIKK